LDESNRLLVMFSCKNAFENLYAISARSAVCFINQYFSWARSHCGRH